MKEQSKAAKRRYRDGDFLSLFFVGEGVDIGGAPDPLTQYVRIFPLMTKCDTWDLEQGDGQYMAEVPDEHYHFVHSSHCLEHLHDPRIALGNWLRIVKPGGHVIVTVPDEDMYEQGVWPSALNDDHKHTFTVFKRESWSPVSINILDLLREVEGDFAVVRIVEVVEFFYYLPGGRLDEGRIDQTQLPNTESAIEFILRKRG